MKGFLYPKRFLSLIKSCGVIALLLGALSGAKASVIVTTDPGLINAFLTGTTTETFDDLAALAINSYSPADATGVTFSSRNGATSPIFDSGGASPNNNPGVNSGVPVGIVAPAGGIAGDVKSGSNVAGPINVAPPPLDVFSPGAFMEVAFPTGKDAAKVGFFVTHGTVSVNVQDDSLSPLESTTVPAGSFVGFTRDSADVRNTSLTSGGAFTIDNFSYAFTSSSGGGGGGSSNVPDSGNTLNLALAAGSLVFANWKLRRKAS